MQVHDSGRSCIVQLLESGGAAQACRSSLVDQNHLNFFLLGYEKESSEAPTALRNIGGRTTRSHDARLCRGGVFTRSIRRPNFLWLLPSPDTCRLRPHGTLPSELFHHLLTRSSSWRASSVNTSTFSEARATRSFPALRSENLRNSKLLRSTARLACRKLQ